MDTKTATRPTTRSSPDALVAEGKTKRIYQAAGGSDLVTVISKDDITAGDGAKHEGHAAAIGDDLALLRPVEEGGEAHRRRIEHAASAEISSFDDRRADETCRL